MYTYLLPANAVHLHRFIPCFSVTPPIFGGNFLGSGLANRICRKLRVSPLTTCARRRTMADDVDE